MLAEAWVFEVVKELKESGQDQRFSGRNIEIYFDNMASNSDSQVHQTYLGENKTLQVTS